MKWLFVIKKYISNHKKTSLVVFLCLIAYYFSLPKTLFTDSYATIIESSDGKLLGGKIANDEQWRFPERNNTPYKLQKAITTYEDEYFFYHWGINPISMAKALWTNIKQGRTVRGGSTISQQVIRLSRKNKPRTYFEKTIEAILATRLEFRYSKEKIIALYASHAPFGGNIVGVDMAAWRYFGVTPEKLSWAEAALLAVLPNSPGLIYPGRNHRLLLHKRNFLLKKLLDKQIISEETYNLSLLEELPQKPHDLPYIAPHLVEKIAQDKQGQRIQTSLNYDLQVKTNQIIERYYNLYRQFEVYNACALVIEVETKRILAYVGNTPTSYNHQNYVNIIHRPRSTGSILKPFLYMAALDSGDILPQELIADVPTQISGYTPQNFQKTYEGATPVNEALYKSLNIPFVLLLQTYGIPRFYKHLKELNLSNINKHPDHYGLSLILGGAESNLFDLCNAYTNLTYTLNEFNNPKNQKNNPPNTINFYKNNTTFNTEKDKNTDQIFSVGSIFKTYDVLTQVHRPSFDSAWKYYESAQKIAWKTGTSFGNRDAWAIGITPKYIVGVWVGNASGEGRPELTGVSNAAPIMFDIFKNLPKSDWFSTPSSDLKTIEVCQQSGLIATDICPKQKISIPSKSNASQTCKYHKTIHLSKDKHYQVHANCELINNILTENWFVLPPVMEWFYKKSHPTYSLLPPFREDCLSNEKFSPLDFIYPKHNTIIHHTSKFGGTKQPIVARVAYTNNQRLFWYLDENYIGETIHFHEKELLMTVGDHFLKCINEQGNEKTIKITVAEK